MTITWKQLPHSRQEWENRVQCILLVIRENNMRFTILQMSVFYYHKMYIYIYVEYDREESVELSEKCPHVHIAAM